MDQEVRYIWNYRRSSVFALYMALQVTTVAYFLFFVVKQFMTLQCNVRPTLQVVKHFVLIINLDYISIDVRNASCSHDIRRAF